MGGAGERAYRTAAVTVGCRALSQVTATVSYVVGGASWQVPTAIQPVPCVFGATFNLTYGSSGRLGTLGAPGKLTFDPAVADTSGTRQLFLFD